MKNEQKKEQKAQKEQDYKALIIKMVKEIENPVILMKIYTVVKTHLEILREKEQED